MAKIFSANRVIGDKYWLPHSHTNCCVGNFVFSMILNANKIDVVKCVSLE